MGFDGFCVWSRDQAGREEHVSLLLAFHFDVVDTWLQLSPTIPAIQTVPGSELRANASPLVALQKGFTMNADVPTKSDSCQAESQQKFRAAIGLRTKHLQSEAAVHEQRLADLHLQLTGEDSCSDYTVVVGGEIDMLTAWTIHDHPPVGSKHICTLNKCCRRNG